MAQTELPAMGYVRLKQILGDKKSDPPVPPVVPVSKSTWWEGIRKGRFPEPCYPFGPRIACWDVRKIRNLIESTEA